ncbi:hypothetical protein GYMLUDRAFT_245151 [Collybiopsis luxurians FD-317 M1]|uniref:Uncharacterized protein n=1 Tax=Collybiopsis luxurians FD-317 M1 TaxID=944289 RepID=A0A0D0B7L4_9AGAR|nr:hypothetical protein GYMLUDRAFT_245151 [Collybiopsis luxurians FD-317 M1]
MVGGHPYISIAVLQLLNHFLEMLNPHPTLLVTWLPLSVWLSLWWLRCYIAQMPLSPLPVHNSESLVNEDIRQSIILVVFFHAWLTMIHLLAVVAGSFFSQYGPSGTLPSCCVIAFATLFLVVGFAQYLEASAIPRSRWGYFYDLYRIMTFVIYLVYALLWIIDLCQGRIELFRRREE